MKRSVRVFGAWLATSMAFSACSADQATSDGGVPSCLQSFTACGGSVVGTWQIQSGCAGPLRSDKCQAQTIFAYNPGYAITFIADGTYTQPSSSATSTYTKPASCFAGGGGASSCAALGSGCSLSIDGSCACSNTVTTFNQQGRYTISGTNLTLMPTGLPVPTTSAFCVQGNTLTEAYTAGESPALSSYAKL